MRRAVVIGLALASLTAGFGAIDLLSPWILHEGTQVSDVGYGTLAGILIPAGLLAQLRGGSAAGAQQLAAAALALLVAGIAAGQATLVVAAAVVAVAFAAAGTTRVPLHARRHRRSRVLAALALAAVWPVTRYALDMAANQRHSVAPHDAHLALQAWAALAAAAFAALFTALLAAARAGGTAVAGLSASTAVLVWAIACLAYPRSAGSVGAPWAWGALAWAIAFALAILVGWSRSTRFATSR